MPRSTRRRPKIVRWAALAALVLIGVLYYSPVRSYLDTRRALAGRLAEVEALRKERAALERRLAARASAQTLERQARRLGFVRPGERLFIVKGIRAWKRGAARVGGSARTRTR